VTLCRIVGGREKVDPGRVVRWYKAKGMSISRVKEKLGRIGLWWQYGFRAKLARTKPGTWFLLGVALLVAGLVLGGLYILFPYADRQSMESALRITASTVATFVGFILVALALIAGRASDAKEHLEAAAPSYKNLSKFQKVRSGFIRALSSLSCSLDDRPMLGPYPHRAPYTYRERYAAIESIYLHLIRPHGSPGWKNVVMGLRHRGFSSREIDRVSKNAGIFDWHPYEFFRALRKVLQLEHPSVPESGDDYLTHVRRKWQSDRIATYLDRVERHQRATGGRFWAAILSSVIVLIGSVLLTLGSTDMMLQCVFVRMGFIGVVITWSIAIFLIIAYLTQFL